MGITRLLSRQEMIRVICLLLFGFLFISGCKKELVKYEYFIEKPSAIKKGDFIEINLGYTRASANWVKAFTQIEKDVIYITGEFTFKEIPQTLLIKLPDPNKDYRVFWVDGDGKKTEMFVHRYKNRDSDH